MLCVFDAPHLPIETVPTEIRRLETYKTFPVDMIIPSLIMKTTLESNPLNSRRLVRRLATNQMPNLSTYQIRCPTRCANFLAHISYDVISSLSYLLGACGNYPALNYCTHRYFSLSLERTHQCISLWKRASKQLSRLTPHSPRDHRPPNGRSEKGDRAIQSPMGTIHNK